VSACAIIIGAGINSGVSSQASLSENYRGNRQLAAYLVFMV
jgi:hypothetical protein